MQTDRNVGCWGDGSFGQLGYGNVSSIGDDVGASAVQLAAGANHTCVVSSLGLLSCWGFGGFGQLGYASTDSIGDDEPPARAGPVFVGF